MKIRLFAWWTDSNNITDRFKAQYVGSHFNDPNIEFVCDNSYDYAIIFGWTQEEIKTDKDHTIYFFMEPSWSKNWDRNAHEKSNRIFITDKTLFVDKKEYIEHPGYFFYGGHGSPIFNVDYILKYNVLHKPKKVSMVVTYRSSSPLTGTNEGNIYRERVELAEAFLNQNIDVDIFGFLWEYSEYKSHPNMKGTIWTKNLALEDYMFSIGIENSTEKNYFTEKLYDVLFFNSVPVYYGAPNIDTLSELKDIIIPINNLGNINDTIDLINDLSEVDYLKTCNKIIEFKQFMFASPKYSVWQRIKQEIKK